MNLPLLILLIVVAYFLLLLLISHLTGSKGDNNTFFRAGRTSPWPLVAFGMIGASISGVSFVSVPGMVRSAQMTYLQMCLGFIPGYLLVAGVLLPIYYRLRLTSIYTYLDLRYGRSSYRTGAWFFLLSKMTRSSAGLYIVCLILHEAAFAHWGVPFLGTVLFMLLLIWLYTRRGGIRTLVWTDSFQTLCLIGTLILITVLVAGKLQLGPGEMLQAVAGSGMGRIFVLDDSGSTQYFWKQFLSGAFVVVVMTGLDQDMMQKNLTCRTLKDAQKDMRWYGLAFVPVNMLFLVLGVLLYVYCQRMNMPLPASGDELLPTLALGGGMGYAVPVLFVLGIVAAAFSSTDSALTALTTSFCIDILGIERKQMSEARATHIRHRAHIGVTAVFVLFVLLFKASGQSSLINTIYVLVGYTYGPLLGLFAFGLFTRRRPRDRYVPLVAVASPLVCYALNIMVPRYTGYHFGYELLMLNGALTFSGLWLLSAGKGKCAENHAGDAAMQA